MVRGEEGRRGPERTRGEDRTQGTDGARDPNGSNEEVAPRLSEFLERSPSRLVIEAALGAAGGVGLSAVLQGGEGSPLLFGVVGAVAATLSLMLTPTRGSAPYRGVRYGMALAALVTLFVSFAAGVEELPVGELLAFGTLVFAVGAFGHGLVAATLDREGTPSAGREMDKDTRVP